MKKNRRWLCYSFLLIILIISLVSIFNFKVDSLGIFGNSNYLSKAAKELANGKNIAGLQNIDERLFQDLIIKNLKIRNDTIAIGSSTTMHLRKSFFLPNSINFFNHSVSGASIEDYIAIIGAYESIHGYLPKKIILGIDPWIFNSNNNQGRWKGLKKYYDFELGKIYNKEFSSNTSRSIDILKWQQLVNFDSTLSNIKFFIRTFSDKQGKDFYIVESTEVDDFIRANDGSIYYPHKIRFIKNDKVQEHANNFAKFKPYSLANYDALSNVRLFEDFVNYLKLNKVNVIFFLPPYNPIAYDLLEANFQYRYIMIAEKYLNEFAALNDFEVRGSYNPHKYNFTNKDFFDGVHGRDQVFKQIFQPYANEG